MRADELDAVASELLKTAELFGEAMGEGRVAVYLEALQDLPGAAICEAFTRLRRSERWFPKPTDVRALVRGDAETRAHDAWLALRAAGTVKEWRDGVEKSDWDAALQALETCGGWRWVTADAPVKDVSYIYRQFVRAFVMAARTGERKAIGRGERIALPAAEPQRALEGGMT